MKYGDAGISMVQPRLPGTAVRPELRARLARAVEDLAPLPVLEGTVMEVRRLADDPEASTDAVVAAIERDAGLAINLLRYANSAAAARPLRARSVRQAVTLTGRRAIARLALEAATYRFLERAPGAGGASRGQMHAHAVTVATIAAGIAERAQTDVDAVHLAGLLHDVGKLVLPVAFGEAALEQLATEFPRGGRRSAREREQLEVDHAYAGALLAEASGLPADLADAIRLHHGDRTGQESPTPVVACVQLGNAIAGLLAGDPADDELIHVALQRLGLPREVLDELAQLSLPASAAPLVEGSVSGRVAELERLATVDDLTGVSNRRRWLAGVRGRLAHGETGGLLICDIDHFKTVNDRHGHRAGDLLLTEIAHLLARHGDTGRLGGDEFALWVTGDEPHAAAVVTAILADINDQLPTRVPGSSDVSLSIGGAFTPRDGNDITSLLATADAALYTAKRAGRRRAHLGAAQPQQTDSTARHHTP